MEVPVDFSERALRDICYTNISRVNILISRLVPIRGYSRRKLLRGYSSKIKLAIKHRVVLIRNPIYIKSRIEVMREAI